MTKHKFVPLLRELICVFIYVSTAVQSARADDHIVDDPIGNNNQLYTLAFNQQSVSNPTSLDIVSTDLNTGDTQRITGFNLAERYQSLSAFTPLPDGTFASSSYYGSIVYLYLFGATKQTLQISGLPTQTAHITSLAGLNDGTLLALVDSKNGGNNQFFPGDH